MTGARAIELLKGIQFCCDFDDCTNAWDCDECVDAFNMAIEALEQEPKRGKWIATEYDTIKCGECGIVYSSALYPRKYCPNCGADMREANKK